MTLVFSSYFFSLSVHSLVSFMGCTFSIFSFVFLTPLYFLLILHTVLETSYLFPKLRLPAIHCSLQIFYLKLRVLTWSNTLFLYTLLSHWDVLSRNDCLCCPAPQRTHTRLQWLSILDLVSLNWTGVWLCSLLTCSCLGKWFPILTCNIIKSL